ncbi:reticulon-like protein B11 isoform X1 [Chenopodium quinoa]|uniref:reticulon-like protein B11 isoform X1 n=1 Tax=Chenopodium quinoa TaxID=63459 RepID=UPI000B793DD4|nr:reticulon-like protein B11 isoform X1 [Chenopodium quinoa]
MGDSHSNRRISVHQTLGSGYVADVLLWRKRFGSILLLVSSTSLWLLFERAGYNPLTFVANVLLLLVAILFFWAKSASLLNRPLPPVPDLEVSDKSIEQAADVIRVWLNRALAVAHEIAVCGNLRVLLQVLCLNWWKIVFSVCNLFIISHSNSEFCVQVAVLLWLISYIGSLCNFVTFVYIGFLLALSVPMLYEKYQRQVDEKMNVACRLLDAGYRKVDATVLRKIPVSLYKKKKKTQ